MAATAGSTCAGRVRGLLLAASCADATPYSDASHDVTDTAAPDDAALGDNALEAFISRLRKKLLGSGVGIRTLRGLGYVLEVSA